MAIYSIQDAGDQACYLFMQRGSYQLARAEDQPLLPSGEVVLYRGIQQSTAFRFLHLDHSRLDEEKGRVWQSYVGAQVRMLSDSVLSFNTIHDRAARSETTHIRDRSWVSDEVAEAAKLDVAGDGLGRELWRAAHQSFTLARWVAERKFGPHFVMGRTPIGNVRFTTFFAGEHEVRVIAPDLVEFFDAQGCQVERHGPSA